MIPALNVDSPVPLYFQIAEAIRSRIANGELAPGDALEPLREAADRLGVNPHTVRHAYTALAREGLLEPGRGLRPTRVSASARLAGTTPDTTTFIRRVIDQAARDHGLTPHELIDRIRSTVELAASRPLVWVMECSRSQCESHAGEIVRRFGVDARPWPLDAIGAPGAGAWLATYFHYNDIRRRWPNRLAQVNFLTIRPAVELIDIVRERGAATGCTQLWLCERDLPTAETIAADWSAMEWADRPRLEVVVSRTPAAEIERAAAANAVVLFPPRVWSELTDAQRCSPRAVELRYEFDASELKRLGERLGWPPAKG
jgi:DNA-binding transcriptional regulator YhcF (GntR family)